MSVSQQVILVVGPRLAGVDGVVSAVRARLPEHLVVESAGQDSHRAPDAVIAVFSAVAPLAASDWALIARAASRTDLVIGAVSKIDAHWNWRKVLEADRTLVAGWAPRPRSMPWVGVAAAPPLGEPNVDDLLAVLRDSLGDPGLKARNMLKRSAHRSTLTREQPSPATAESRLALQRVRLRLLRFIRDECASMRAALRDAASTIPAGGAGRFEARVRDDAARFLAQLDEEIARAVDEFALDESAMAPPGTAPAIAGRPSASRRLETRLMAVLGGGFGLGIALASNRLLSGLAPGLSIVGWVAGGLIGSALVVWVVRTRGVLHERALLDRWVTDVAATLRWHGEARLAERLLEVELAQSTSRRRPRFCE